MNKIVEKRQRRVMKLIGLALGFVIGINNAVANPFAMINDPSTDPQEVVGSYANGCVFGASPLAQSGLGYQTMRQSRNRHYGHQSLVDYVESLGIKRATKGELLLIGDMSQPRGGRMPSDHASHQLGLDVDIWLYPMTKEQFKKSDIENLTMRSVVNRAEGTINHYWDDRYFDLLADAASDHRVDRIFINPVIKQKLCEMDQDAPWHYKVRPWFGHDSHFHVRLKCPSDSVDCVTQAPIPKASGCNADLNNWIRDQSEYTRNPKPVSKSTATSTKSRPLPQRCHQLITQ